MKKLILFLPLILMACGETASEKMEREFKEGQAKYDQEKVEIESKLESMMGKEAKDSMDKALKEGAKELIEKSEKK